MSVESHALVPRFRGLRLVLGAVTSAVVLVLCLAMVKRGLYLPIVLTCVLTQPWWLLLAALVPALLHRQVVNTLFHRRWRGTDILWSLLAAGVGAVAFCITLLLITVPIITRD
jgi:hypothetical protein